MESWQRKEGLLSFCGDEKRLTQAIEKVLYNVIKHCRKEGLITIKVSEQFENIKISIASILPQLQQILTLNIIMS